WERLPRTPIRSRPAMKSFGGTPHSFANSWMRFDMTLPCYLRREQCRKRRAQVCALGGCWRRAQRAYRPAAANERAPALGPAVQPGTPPAGPPLEVEGKATARRDEADEPGAGLARPAADAGADRFGAPHLLS